MKKMLKLSVLATALLGATLAVTLQPRPITIADRLAANCCGDPVGCPDPLNPMCPVGTDPAGAGLQAR